MKKLLVGLLLSVLLIGAPLPALAADDAINLLLQKAEYWSRRDRPDLAREALNTILATDPGNTQALARLAELEADQGNRARADSLLGELARQQPAGGEAQRAASQAVNLATNRQALLTEARRLARTGDAAGAVAKYKESFGGPEVPAGLALEYYQTLAGTPAGWEQARDGLARLADAPKAGQPEKLAYAKVLTYRESSRRDGIARLSALAQGGPLSPDAKGAWREALIWLEAQERDRPLYDAYLAMVPGDKPVADRLAQATRPVSVAGRSRAGGYAALDKGDLASAERQFNAALSEDAKDAEARAGLGLVRLRQERFGEARDLLEAAAKAAPNEAAKWRAALDSAGFWQSMAQARSQRDAGRLEEAATKVRALTARGGADGRAAWLLLADIEDRRGDKVAAERAWHTVLAADPNNADALNGLAGSLLRQGREGEARDLLANLSPAVAARLPSYPRMRAGIIRADAMAKAAAGDAAGARSLYAEALAITPGDAWLRLDYARLLLRQNEAAMAENLMALALPETGPADAAALNAVALFESERRNWAAVGPLLDRIPAREMTPELRDLRQRAQMEAAIAEAKRFGPMARDRLLALRAQATGPETRGALAAALADAGAMPEGLALLRPELLRPQVSPAAQVQYALLLLKAKQRPDAAAILRQLDMRADLSATEREAVDALRTAMAVDSADEARQQRNYADAYDALAPLFRDRPSDPVLTQALARLYQSADRPGEALALYEGLLRREPDNVDAAQAAADVALAAGKPARAQAIVSAALRRAPDDAALMLRQAQLLRADGNDRAALASLNRARNERLAALTDSGSAPQTAANNPFRNKMDTAAPAVPEDGLLVAIEQEREATRTALAPQLFAEGGLRTRSGSGGSSRLMEITATAGASLPLFGGDRLTAKATAVRLDAGGFGNGAEAWRLFGSGMFRSVEDALKPADQQDQGVAFNLAYQRGSLQLDIGSTPLGLEKTRLEGGISWQPHLTDALQLRLKAERRPVTDSLLSYGGARDPLTGERWGAIDSTGGSIGAVYDTGLIGFYADVSYADLKGINVANNDKLEASLGGFLRLLRTPTSELTLGANLTSMSYDRNLRHFSFGHGGYFSPQEFYAVTFPVEYRGQEGDLKYSLGAGIGMRYFREDGVELFPTDSNRQKALLALVPDRAKTDPAFATGYAGQSSTGIGYNLEGSLEYRLATGIALTGTVKLRRAADWTEGAGLVGLRASIGD